MSTSGVLLDAKSTDSGLESPVFVVGVFRSGTSLLYTLLNQHSQISLMYECDAWSFPDLFSALRFKGDWLERQEFFNQTLSRHRLIYGNSLRGLENVRTPEDLYQIYGQGKRAAVYGEKSPFYCTRLRRLAGRNPKSPFILIWRDPMEVYRSVVLAGKNNRFFRRPGMLSRLILYQEKMLEQALELEKAGARLHHITYADLVDRTHAVCKGVCEFLNVPFDPQMLDINSADLSAVYEDAQHDYLRRGVIQRQQIFDELLSPKIAGKLERFRNRWSRMNRAWFPGVALAANAPEPSLLERSFHRIAGNLLCAWDDAKRAIFEFLPLTWLRTYRETAGWWRRGQPERRPSLGKQIKRHWITIVISYLLIAGLAGLDALYPHLSFLPFYAIPCAILALTINWRWGSSAALIAAGIGPAFLGKIEAPFAPLLVFLWNTGMRFLVLQAIVLLADRVRREVASGKTEKA